jgi:ABC-type antimicrobial peptide transport system permease subunit
MIDFWNRYRRDRLAVYSLGVIALFVAAAILASMLAPYDPSAQFFDGLTPEGSPLPPSARFWFGTDTNGRDQFSRLLYGAQTSLLIGIVANGIAVFIGAGLGLVAGYVRGLLGADIMRFTDLMMAFPPLLLAMHWLPSQAGSILSSGDCTGEWVDRRVICRRLRFRAGIYRSGARHGGRALGDLRYLLPHLVLPRSLSMQPLN